MQNSTPEIAVATRTFGNSKMQEGLRVKAGTRFAVGKPQGGLQMITAARYRQLLAVRLVRPLGPEDAAAAPAADDPSRKRPIDSHAAEAIEKNEAEAKANVEKPKEPMRRPSARAAARRRTQEPDPPAPRLIRPASQPAAAPVGSPNGSPAPASSSAAGPASSTSATSSKPRGRRRGSAG